MQRLYMDKQGRVTIPRRIRRQLGMGEETPLFAELGPAGLVLRPLDEAGSAHSEGRQQEDAECVVGGETLKPAERRRILNRLLSS